MNELTKKLRLVREGLRFCLVNPPAGYAERLSLPAGTAVSDELVEGAEIQQVFVTGREELEALAPRLRVALAPGGILWLSYPKQSGPLDSDLNRDKIWALLQEYGLRPVAQIALDETWSAMRFKKEA